MTESQKAPRGKPSAIFGRLRGWVGRHKKLSIFIVVLAIVIVVAVVVMSNLRGATAGPAQAPQTITLAKMDLEQIVSGTGTLQSSATRQVTSGLSYNIAEVYVQEGDKVEAGQLLARLDTADIDKSIENTRESIADAEAQDALALSQAQRKLQDAIDQYGIDEARLNGEIDKAAGSLDSANGEKSSAGSARDQKKAAWNDARKAVENYTGDKDAAANPEYAALVQAESAAKAEYDAAEQTYQTRKSAADQAQTAYDSAVQQRDTTLRQDNISIENARDNVNTLKLKDSAASYRTQLEGYLDDKADCEITAPVSGTITAMAAEVGQSAGGAAGAAASVSATALFTIEDVTRLEITASIPEYDATVVRTGMQAAITSDALSGEAWTGSVKSVSAKATDNNGNFTVVVEVVSPVGELAIGMSAKINIITDSKSDVFAVPYDAVTTNDAGDSVVYLHATDAQPDASRDAAGDASGDSPAAPAGTPVVVSTGMETDYYIEIAGEGLEAGMVVLADPEGKNVSTESSTGSFMMGGGF